MAALVPDSKTVSNSVDQSGAVHGVLQVEVHSPNHTVRTVVIDDWVPYVGDVPGFVTSQSGALWPAVYLKDPPTHPPCTHTPPQGVPHTITPYLYPRPTVKLLVMGEAVTSRCLS